MFFSDFFHSIHTYIMSSVFAPVITEILKTIESYLSIRIITPAPEYPARDIQFPKCVCCNADIPSFFIAKEKDCGVCRGLIKKANKFRRLNTPVRNIKMPFFQSSKDEHIMNYFRKQWPEFNPQIIKIMYEDQPDITKKRVIRLTRDRVVMTKYSGKS